MKTQYVAWLSGAALIFASTFCVYAADDKSLDTKAPATAAQTPGAQTVPTKKATPPQAVSDCNHNGINDLDEFWPPDCYGKLTSGSNAGNKPNAPGDVKSPDQKPAGLLLPAIQKYNPAVDEKKKVEKKPTYPGPGVETWQGKRFPPPAPAQPELKQK